MTLLGTAFSSAGVVVAIGSFAAGQITPVIGPEAASRRVAVDEVSRVVDPKLTDGKARLTFHLEPSGARAVAFVEIHPRRERGRALGRPIVRLFKGFVQGGAEPIRLEWDGRDASGAPCRTGSYTLRLFVPGLIDQETPLDIVRLGVTEIEAQDSPAVGADEFQMVYFRKGTAGGFFATPAIHEYVNLAAEGQISDLDLDDGTARPAVAVHAGVASPVLDANGNYSTGPYNYPLAYVKGASPRLELTFGTGATGPDGTAMAVGYPIPDCELRLRCDQGVVPAEAQLVQPGGKALVDLAALPNEVGRTDVELTLRWQARPAGETEWIDVPGAQVIPLRFYTLLGPPQWKVGATGMQYSGPWVEVADYVAGWKTTLGLAITDQASLTDVFVHGFFGQNGGIGTAIEGVVYDAYPLGGDGGATHYLEFFQWNMNLSALLNSHGRGKFVNCSDNMGAATTMLSMMGATNVRSLRLGSMTLRAIWGIGTPGYTLNLWGSSHGFSYHHIITDDNGTNVSDTCMQLDEDGSPMTLPGTPGWNVRRPWAGINGYMNLAASNVVTKNVEALPGLQ